jgi:hypothetical protein
MKTFIGIYTDAEPIKKVEVPSFNFFQNKPQTTNNPKKTGVVIFTAENLMDALQKAKDQNFSSFAEISGKIYYEKIDF